MHMGSARMHTHASLPYGDLQEVGTCIEYEGDKLGVLVGVQKGKECLLHVQRLERNIQVYKGCQMDLISECQVAAPGWAQGFTRWCLLEHGTCTRAPPALAALICSTLVTSVAAGWSTPPALPRRHGRPSGPAAAGLP